MRSVSQLRSELPQQTRPYSELHLRAVVERARSNAATLGFSLEEHVLIFLKCVILVGDDLSSGDSKCPDVYFSLNLPGKPPMVRLERALKIAQRVNARGGVQLVPLPGAPSVASESGSAFAPPASVHSPAPSPASIAEDSIVAREISEQMAPAAQRQRSEKPAFIPSHAPPPPAHDQRDITQALPPETSAAQPHRQPLAQPPDDNKLPEIDGFKILEKIGSGGMGTVYRAYNHRLDVEVAIKIFKTLHPDAKSLLLREARAAARLQHPNIVQVLDYQEFGRGAYYAMQLVKGVDAHDLIQRVSGRMAHDAEADGVLRAIGLTHDEISPEVRSILAGKQAWHRLVAWWMAGVADGLDRAHREGIIHRDIKPSNLLLARDGRMTITDFGLALRRDDPSSVNTARAGTPRYLAPERVADWASGADLSGADGRIDTWAVGATMYELLTYRPAYDGSREGVMRDIVTLDPLPPSQVIWAVPPELDRICLRAMKRNPEERYQQAGDLASELREWLVSDGQTNRVQGQSGVFTNWFRKGNKEQ
jgi:serine/threonine protein kinase